MLISGAEKVVDLDAPKLAKRTLGISKVIEIHWRGHDFQGFALFSHGSLFEAFLTSLGIVLGAFWDSFGGPKIDEKNEANRGGQSLPHRSREEPGGVRKIKPSEL